jgi:heat shock protein HtpX
MANGLFGHIQANRARSVVLLIALFAMNFVMAYGLLLIVDGYFIRHFEGIRRLEDLMALSARHLLLYSPVVAGLTALWAFFGTWMSQSLIDMATGAREPYEPESRRLSTLLENLCISRGVPVPKLEIIDDPALNAYASGMMQDQYAITVTTGLLETLDEDEIEAVLAHELTHVLNEDVRLMTFAGVIVGALAFVAGMLKAAGSDWGFWKFWGSSRGGGGNAGNALIGLAAIAAGFAIALFAWMGAALIRLSLSRKREFLADAGAAELTKNPDAMISALRKISGNSDLVRAPAAVMDMCIDNPKESWLDFLSTHPSIDERVMALKIYAGGIESAPNRTAAAKPSFAALMRADTQPKAAGFAGKMRARPAQPKAALAISPAPVRVAEAPPPRIRPAGPEAPASALAGISADRLKCARVAPRAVRA